MFKCKACPCKDAHIAALEGEIKHLRSLILPTNAFPSIGLREADALLSGHQNMIEITEEEQDQIIKGQKEMEDTLRERDNLLTGNYV